MKIQFLQLSNILSFRYAQDVGNAEKLVFDDGLNIIIGENGSGKSTALEVINFLFRRVFYRQYNLNQDLYFQRNAIAVDQQRQILQPINEQSYRGFRLEPNWNSDAQPQTIRISLKLDEIDFKNIEHLKGRRTQLYSWIQKYTTRGDQAQVNAAEIYTIDINLQRAGFTFTIQPVGCAQDFGLEYLTEYNFFKESIALYNLEHSGEPMDSLYESFTLIGSYRNYHAFNPSVTLRDAHPSVQIRQLHNADFNRSLNANDGSEPAIFALVRLRVAQEHFGLISQKRDEAECEAAANELPFVRQINERLVVVNLRCKIKLIDLRTWQYSFEFYDLRRDKTISDINSLSAGQKAIVHLVFEAYGRGDLKGGLVIIDEPEIHLHYQFQHEYLQVIKDLNRTQKCQYILVTHSEALINSDTIGSVRRFSLSQDGYTGMRFPQLTGDQKLLIRILDNTRSTYAFFAKKVILVEGDSDRYFFKAVVQLKYRYLDQEIAVLHVGGKKELLQWTKLFESFGLLVYRIADLDYAYDTLYPADERLKLKTEAAVQTFRSAHPDCDFRIEQEYNNGTFILKRGELEQYLGIEKDLSKVISFCSANLTAYLEDDTNPLSIEIRKIIRRITES